VEPAEAGGRVNIIKVLHMPVRKQNNEKLFFIKE
jgi:hypothetical protein